MGDNNKNLNYASVFERLKAFIIDVGTFYCSILWTILVFPMARNILINPAVMVWLFILEEAIFSIAMQGQTVGCKIVGIKIVAVSGDKPKKFQLILRVLFLSLMAVPHLYLPLTISFFIKSIIIFFLISPTKERKQTWWDFVGGTTVVKCK